MSDWEWRTVSMIALLGWLVLTVSGMNSYRFNTNIVVRSILAWGLIILVIAVIVLNREAIGAFFAPIRAYLP